MVEPQGLLGAKASGRFEEAEGARSAVQRSAASLGGSTHSSGSARDRIPFLKDGDRYQ